MELCDEFHDTLHSLTQPSPNLTDDLAPPLTSIGNYRLCVHTRIYQPIRFEGFSAGRLATSPVFTIGHKPHKRHWCG